MQSTRQNTQNNEYNGDAVLDDALRLLWQFRVELSLAGVLAITYIGLQAVFPAKVAGVLVGVVVGLVLAASPTRRQVARWVTRSRWRRRVERALSDLSGRHFGSKPPKVRVVGTNDHAIEVRLALRSGQAPAHVEQVTEQVAASLRIREVRARRDPNDASKVYLSCVRRDPLSGPPLTAPICEVPKANLWEPIEIGLDEDGQAVLLSLAEHNFLVGGVPRAGKSGLLQQMAAWTALDPKAALYCLDAKVVELARWAPVAAGFAGADVGEALRVLATLDAEMQRRYSHLVEHGARKVTEQDGFALQILIIDELMVYLTADKQQSNEFAALLRRLVALGRAAGIVCVIATQKPGTDVVPSAIRDNMADRVAFRTTTRDASDTILGAGWAARGYSAADLDASSPGVCWLLAEGSLPKKVRCFYLDDETLDSIVARAKGLR
ncbi:MAG: FtsK/SpoIIIE domain-containing protein [Actinomycetota bacterium]|nr:FtsK/SpoIIIE domain-containing protein [Actinomycetota bacterium]